VAAAALLLLGCSISFAAYALALDKVDAERWKAAEAQASQFNVTAGRLKIDCEQARKEFTETNEIGQHLVGNVEGRIRWLELLKAINGCLPPDPPRQAGAPPLADDAERITESKELHVTSLACQPLDDVSQWVKAQKFEEAAADTAGKTPGPVAPAPGKGAGSAAPDAGAGGTQPPTGDGYIIQIKGYHFHNANRPDAVRGAEYVRRTLIDNLRAKKVKLAGGEQGGPEEVTMRELGISCPVLVNHSSKTMPFEVPRPTGETNSSSRAAPEAKPGPGGAADRPRPAAAAGDNAPATVKLQRFDFDVQFCWQPKTPTQRREARKPKEQTAAAAAPR